MGKIIRTTDEIIEEIERTWRVNYRLFKKFDAEIEKAKTEASKEFLENDAREYYHSSRLMAKLLCFIDGSNADDKEEELCKKYNLD